MLSWLSLVWMGLEGGVALIAGILAGSIALIGFGIDSAIEGLASVIIIWRFTGARMLSATAEERAQKLVAIQFFLLAPYVGYEAVAHLFGGERPEVSVLGMLLTTSSLIGMPLLGRAKQRSPAGSALRPPTARGPRTCSAPIWRRPFSRVCSATPCSAPGGWIRWRRCSSPSSPCAKGSRPGAARAAASRARTSIPPA